MVILPSGTHDFRVAMYNPDGSAMGMCGNGIRCVTRFVIDQKMWGGEERAISFDVEGRTVSCEAREGGAYVRVDMGEPTFDPRRIPLARESELVEGEIKIDSRVFLATAVSMGNPHCVMYVDTDTRALALEVGPRLEHHEWFPERCNVMFSRVLGRERIRVDPWERGAGATLACGTGACAAVVAGARIGACERRTVVELPGGEVEIDWSEKNGHVYLTGPAREIAKGEFTVEFLNSVLK
jgi:diaminopimelate epimerase